MLSALLDVAFEVVAAILEAVVPAAHEKLAEWRRSDSIQLRLIGWLALLLGIGIVVAIVWIAIILLS